jgi:hypothetical protein
VIFTQEIYLDYNDYEQPMHSKTKIISQVNFIDIDDDDEGEQIIKNFKEPGNVKSEITA